MNAQHHVRVVLLAAILTLSLVMVGPASAHGLTATRVAIAGPIYLGQITSLSGIAAMGPGIRQLYGAQLAVNQINAQGGIKGRPLQLVISDDHSTNAGGITALQRLLQDAPLTALIEPGASAEVHALSPSVQAAGLPAMIGGTNPLTTHEGNRWVFRTRPNDTYATKALSTFAVTTLHLTKIAILYQGDAGGMGGNTGLLANFKTLGVTPVADQAYPMNAKDLTTQIQAVKASGATALITWGGSSDDFLLIARQMHQLGVHVTWLGNPILSVDLLRHQAGPLLYGTYAVTDYVPGQNPQAVAFATSLEATFHMPGNFASAYPYDAIQILARAMRNVGTNPEAIRAGILAIKAYSGVEGTYTFDSHGDGLHQYTLVQNMHGQLRIIRVISF